MSFRLLFQHISNKRSSILKTVHYSEGHQHLNEEASYIMGKKFLTAIHLIEGWHPANRKNSKKNEKTR